MVSLAKDPNKVKAGRASALKRWGAEPRTVRLDTLDADTARLIRALLAQRPPKDAPEVPSATEAA